MQVYPSLTKLAEANGFSKQYAHKLSLDGRVKRVESSIPLTVYVFDGKSGKARRTKIKSVTTIKHG